MTDVALAAPVNGTIEIAGPERLRISEFVGRFLSAKRDPREVTTDVHARYFGVELDDQSLTPGDNPRIGATPSTTALPFRYAQTKEIGNLLALGHSQQETTHDQEIGLRSGTGSRLHNRSIGA